MLFRIVGGILGSLCVKWKWIFFGFALGVPPKSGGSVMLSWSVVTDQKSRLVSVIVGGMQLPLIISPPLVFIGSKTVPRQ